MGYFLKLISNFAVVNNQECIMAGLYIHIPFCASRCIYCGFYSTTLLELRSRYVDALCREMSLQKTHPSIETIYLGGGTPSQLSHDDLRCSVICLSTA